MARKVPDHIAGLLRYLAQPDERANEDLALGYFRHVFPGFSRQADAAKSDGHVPGHFVLELKGSTGDWLKGMFQGLAYNRELDFSIIVVAAKNFLAVWRVEDLPEDVRAEAQMEPGAPNKIGAKLGTKYKNEKKAYLGRALWKLNPAIMLDGLFASDQDIILDAIGQFESALKKARRIRLKVTPKNFPTVLKQMVPFFDEPLKAVRAFYSIIFGWDDSSKLELSHKQTDSATLGGETIRNLVPGTRFQLKELIESYAVRIADDESYDDFFAQYDRALDTVDPEFRKKHGIFFTDLDLSRFVMWLVRNKRSELGDIGKNYLVIDPACGSGNLVSNWRSPLELRHKVVSEIEPELLFAVERRMAGDRWHAGRFTVVPKVTENQGLNFLEKSAEEYLDILRKYLEEKNQKPDRPLAFLCNPPYRNDDDQSAGSISYDVHESITQLTGDDASAERYCCFLAQMKLICQAAHDSGLPGDSLLLLFTKAAWLTNRTIFQNLRREMLGAFEDVAGVIVNSKEFFDVSGSFPVAFTIWRYRPAQAAAALDPLRPILLQDLTWLKKEDVAALPWNDATALDRECTRILSDPRSLQVAYGEDRQTIREWSGGVRFNFYRNRRKNETRDQELGGLPKGDPRLKNKTVYGDPEGAFVGFMDNLTPCRIAEDTLGLPWFRLDNPIMDCRRARCLSGPPDQKGYCPNDQEKAERLFLWFAIERVFALFGYPMSADAFDLWAPIIPSSLRQKALNAAYAIALVDNECVEARFPANNPSKGAPELYVSNPMSPNNPESYWSTHLASKFSANGTDPASKAVSAVRKLYSEWKKRFRKEPELPTSISKPYFIGEGFVTASSGLLQIRDYCQETGDDEILVLFRDVQESAKALKAEFRSMLLDPEGINYFGKNTPKETISKAPSKFDMVLRKRVILASYLVKTLHSEQYFGRTKLAKLFYLADAVNDLKLETEYVREAAGPLDPRALYNAKYGIESLASRAQCFETVTVQGSKGEMIRYIPAPKIDEAVLRMQAAFGSKQAAIESLVELFKGMDTDRCEIVATLYACWNDLLLEGTNPTDDEIVQEFLEQWHERKQRFPKARLVNAIAWMRNNKIVPQGTGKATRRRN